MNSRGVRCTAGRATRGPNEIEDFVGWEDELQGRALYRR